MTSKSTKTAVICRICLLGTQEKYLSLFEPFKEYTPAYHINSITNLNINDEESLPDTLCTTCLLDLENAINFKLKCESSNVYLKQTLDKINTDECLSKLEESDRKSCDVKIEKSDDCSNYEADYLVEDIYNEEFTLNPVNDDIINKSENELSFVPEDDNYVKIDVPTNSPVICHDCEGVFKSKCKLRVHWKKEHIQKNFDCELCYARFRGMHALKRHKLVSRERCNLLKTVIIAGVGKSRIFTCPTCKYDTKNEYNMQQHLLIHNGEKKFKCPMCDKCFVQRSGCKNHLENFHKIIRKTVTCEVCGVVLLSQAKFRKHMERKHSPQQFECDYCKKKFNYKSLLVNHIRIHIGIKPFTCKYCAKQFTLSSGLIVHKRNVHFNKSYVKLLDCPLCPYKSVKLSAISDHIAKHETGQFSCDLCGTFHESELKLWFHKICHLPRQSIARRTCPVCDRLYDKLTLMKNHARRCHLFKKIKTFDAEDVISKIKCAMANENTTNYRKKQKEDVVM